MDGCACTALSGPSCSQCSQQSSCSRCSGGGACSLAEWQELMGECLELDPGLMSAQRCFMQDPFSLTERDRNAREGKGNDGPSSATLRWLETPRPGDVGKNQTGIDWGIVCIAPIQQMDHGLSLAVLRCCLTHTRSSRLTDCTAVLIMSPKLSVLFADVGSDRLPAPRCRTPTPREDDDSRSACVLGRLVLGMDGIRETSICLSNQADRANNPLEPYLLSDAISRYGITHLHNLSST